MVPVPRDRTTFLLVSLPDAEAHPSGAIIDWLNFTFPMQRTLSDLFALVWEYMGSKFGPATERRTGFHFYERSFDLSDTGAKFAFGGNAGTGLISLSGEACYLITDWSRVVELGRDVLGGQISRTDPARDDYLGVHSVDDALQLYRDGLFGAGGRRPRMKQYGNWDSPDGTGRSIVIGSRINGKRLEVYEKGMQLGALSHPWVRWEACLGNTGRKIPWEVLLEPGRYLAGAYPKALGWVSTEASRIVTLQKQTQISYDALVGHASRHYGALIALMQQVEGSPEKVVEKLTRPGTPRRLQHPAIERPAEWLE
ncbi:MAG TPA: replication initiation factor domain-containing protein [Candidatus Binatia bacterium]|nr:replication initiation factor domain-containing protein [Candidatus Binatia bacterium]